jgi:starch synthase
MVYDGKVRVLFATSEVAGLFKLGGLADVSQALPLALSKVGVSVGVALPYYSDIHLPKAHGVGQLVVEFGGEKEIVFVFAAPLGHNAIVYLFRHPRLNDYRGKHMTEVFAFYCAVVSEFYRQSKRLLGHEFDIIHCNDWHTGLIPLLLGESRKVGHKKTDSSRSNALNTVITVHNLMYQGDTVATRIVDNLSVSKKDLHVFHKNEQEEVSFLREGLEHADSITTVSPTYAKEVLKVEFSRNLVDVFSRRSDKIVGILNGIDTDLWNPKTDTHLAVNYSSYIDATKAVLKRDIQKKVGLAHSDVPLFAFIGRIEPKQKGIDILIDSLAILGQQAALQLIILGTGEERLVHELTKLAHENHGRIAFVNAFDETLAHQIYAGADCMIVPSKFEPCGLIQLIAMRYGTLPLVRKTGGLADTVVDGKTGFVFLEYSADALADKITEAIVTCRDKKDVWGKMVDRAMRQDFSWKKSALKYKQLYKKLMGE